MPIKLRKYNCPTQWAKNALEIKAASNCRLNILKQSRFGTEYLCARFYTAIFMLYIPAAALSSDLAEEGPFTLLSGIDQCIYIVERKFSVIYSVLPLKPLPFCSDHTCYIMMLTELLSWPKASHDFLIKWQQKKENYPFLYKDKFPLRVSLIVLF